jgi:hypothetical protein
MTLRQWLTHLRHWLVVFPWPTMRNHVWTRRADPPGEPYTCIGCGRVATEKELDDEDE